MEVLWASMSAEGDLLFPQADYLSVPDLCSFSEYGDLSRDSFLLNVSDEFSLLKNYDCLKPLSISELSEFSLSLEGIKEEDEDADEVHQSKGVTLKDDSISLQVDASQEGVCLQKVPDSGNVFYSRNVYMNTNDSLAENSIVPGNAWSKSSDSICFSLKDEIVCGSYDMQELCSLQEVAHIHHSVAVSLPPESEVMEPCTQQSIPLQHCSIIMTGNKVHSEMMSSSASTDLHVNSPLTSPSSSITTASCITNLDGNSANIFSFEESGEKCHLPTNAVSAVTSMEESGLPVLQAKAYHRIIPHHLVLGGPNCASMQRSQSSHALGQLKSSGNCYTCPKEANGSLLKAASGSVEYLSPNGFGDFQAAHSPCHMERALAGGSMRRVFSTGDIQACNGIQVCYGDTNMNCIEFGSGEESIGVSKIGHYTAEERNIRLQRYRQKRNQRNFSKKIKYACRKTLADSRPRIRGRFARTLEDSGDLISKECGVSYDYESEVDSSNGRCTIPSLAHAANFWNATSK
ncbi:hypothetical protein KP509_10G036500 [Ceratopteris richardii]|uniref:CCT domain-containing protein n=1 Tax=Ceratopteris richardii TaxID=49495 RepID=A0A8T2U0A6_CERRI|nr:hypothetical protein KP509_10G036500 [Ceratopteris richardii]